MAIISIIIESFDVTRSKGSSMRLQLALNVDDLDEAIAFYSKMFGTEPAKTKPGYANFAIENPPLKLVLFEGAGASGSINHLGVEVESAAEVVAAEARLSGTGLETTGVDETICCYAEKTETWVHAPDGNRWEWYVKQGDTDQLVNVVVTDGSGESTGCCS
jgi:catechol 2,3-dioxygenase-like lactoylglutathione lyase family enzyme